jgi:hypothetical protein
LVQYRVSKATNKFLSVGKKFAVVKLREAAVSPSFKSTEFLDLSPEELLAKCREYRAEAETLAASTSTKMRDAYSHLVMQWAQLADEIQNGIQRQSGAANMDDKMSSLPPAA